MDPSQKKILINRGSALMIMIILLLIITIVGIWALRSSEINILKAGNKQATTKLQLYAEEALGVATRRFQEIANFEGNLIDSIAQINGTTPRTLGTLVADAPPPLGLCMPVSETDTSCSSPACNDGTTYAFDAPTQNVVCNFLGAASKTAQVAIVRKTDQIISQDERNGIFLINVIARDSNNRRQVTQGVMVVPYNPITRQPNETPYLANTSKTLN
jgi:hypothetical protein